MPLLIIMLLLLLLSTSLSVDKEITWIFSNWHGEPAAQLSRGPSRGCHDTEGSPVTQVDFLQIPWVF